MLGFNILDKGKMTPRFPSDLSIGYFTKILTPALGDIEVVHFDAPKDNEPWKEGSHSKIYKFDTYFRPLGESIDNATRFTLIYKHLYNIDHRYREDELEAIAQRFFYHDVFKLKPQQYKQHNPVPYLFAYLKHEHGLFKQYIPGPNLAERFRYIDDKIEKLQSEENKNGPNKKRIDHLRKNKEKYMEAAMILLATLHNRGDERLVSIGRKKVRLLKSKSKFEYILEHFIGDISDVLESRSIKAPENYFDELKEEFSRTPIADYYEKISLHNGEEKKVVIIGDYYPLNIIIQETEEESGITEKSLEEKELDLNDVYSNLCIVDFSQARISTPKSDVADFVTYPGLRLYKDQIEDLVSRYLDKIANLEHRSISKDEFQEYTSGLRLVSLTRTMGGASHSRTNQKELYLRKADEILREHSGFVTLRTLLGKHVDEMKNNE